MKLFKRIFLSLLLYHIYAYGFGQSNAHIREVPVLCYHQVREWNATDSKTAKTIITPPLRFREQMKMLADSGYHAVLPQQLADYFKTGSALPDKPVIISFDDGSASQYVEAVPVLDAFGFKAVFFIMTVTIGKANYMSAGQIKTLSAKGHTIGLHTWDHHNVTTYSQHDWKIQIADPSTTLSTITGKPVRFFAYPYGVWNSAAFPALKKYGIVLAFQLSEKQDIQEPALTVRRIIADSRWTGKQLLEAIKKSFK